MLCFRCFRPIRPGQPFRRRGAGRVRHVKCRMRRSRTGRWRPVGITDLPRSCVPSALRFLQKPEVKLVMGVMRLFGNYLEEVLPTVLGPSCGQNLSELDEELRAKIQASVEAEINSEAHEPICTFFDERQEGRSEVVREIAHPKQS